MDKGRILFIDDELCPGQQQPSGNYMWYYTVALKDADYDVVEVLGPDDALAELANKDQHFDLVILDIMMPPGNAYKDDDTRNGLRTGVLLARRIENDWPKLPILVLTNVLEPEALDALKALPSVKRILTKPKYTPFQVFEEIRRIGEDDNDE